MHPRSRRDDVVVRELADETLIYIPETHQAHCLNKSAALVWRHCDGKTSRAELARLLAGELKIAADLQLVDVALHDLEEAKLLLPGTRATPRSFSRRDALAKLGAGLAALPVVMSIVAPEAKAQASPTTEITNIVNNNNNITESGAGGVLVINNSNSGNGNQSPELN
ncbi:MAG: PqqD family protein [Gemmataceae bacterium]